MNYAANNAANPIPSISAAAIMISQKMVVQYIENEVHEIINITVVLLVAVI